MPAKLDRYVNLRWALDELFGRGLRSLRYLEVGTYDGRRAAQLLRHWNRMPGGPPAAYYGFDFFEDLTPEMSRAELSKSRPPPSLDAVRSMLRDTGAAVSLYKGNTRDTLPRIAPELPLMDLVFVDGGHSLETIASDWAALQPVIGEKTVVLLDDYYVGKDDFGCAALVGGLPIDFRVRLLDPVDTYEHTGLSIRMVRVVKDPA